MLMRIKSRGRIFKTRLRTPLHRHANLVPRRGGPMRALIVEDQPLLVRGLQEVMGGLQPTIAVSCADCVGAARHTLASEPPFDLVLLDLELDGSGGLDFLDELRSAHPALPIVVLSASNANDLVGRAIFMGAMGFVLKRASTDTIVEALRLVLSGVVYVPPLKLRSPCERAPRASVRDEGWGIGLAPAEAVPPSPYRRLASMQPLTSRQAQVLELLLLGQSNKLIARALNLSVYTVKDHVGSLLRMLNVTSRTQAVLAIGRLAGKPPHLANASSSRPAS
jgi:DNA-binding NarL/FixJ family response regulator